MARWFWAAAVALSLGYGAWMLVSPNRGASVVSIALFYAQVLALHAEWSRAADSRAWRDSVFCC